MGFGGNTYSGISLGGIGQGIGQGAELFSRNYQQQQELKQKKEQDEQLKYERSLERARQAELDAFNKQQAGLQNDRFMFEKFLPLWQELGDLPALDPNASLPERQAWMASVEDRQALRDKYGITLDLVGARIMKANGTEQSGPDGKPLSFTQIVKGGTQPDAAGLAATVGARADLRTNLLPAFENAVNTRKRIASESGTDSDAYRAADAALKDIEGKVRLAWKVGYGSDWASTLSDPAMEAKGVREYNAQLVLEKSIGAFALTNPIAARL